MSAAGSLAWWGSVLGALAATGALLAASRASAIRRPPIAARVLPYVRDLPEIGRSPAPRTTSVAPTSAVVGVFGPFLRSAADGVEAVMGGAQSVRRRLDRAALDKTLHEFRVEQVVWGLVGFAAAAAYSLLRTLGGSGGVLSALVLCAIGFVGGVVLRDNHLSSQIKQRERRILAEFPTIAELLSLAVAAGEGPVAALDRVCRRSRGDLSADLERVLAAVRTGEPVALAFDALAVGFRRAGIERGLDLVDQGGELGEAAADAVALDQLDEDAHREMGLAGPGRADEEETRLAESSLLEKPLDIVLGERARALELRPFRRRRARRLEVGEPAMAIPRRDAGGLHQAPDAVLLAAGAGPGRTRAAIRLEDPPPATTEGACLVASYRQHCKGNRTMGPRAPG